MVVPRLSFHSLHWIIDSHSSLESQTIDSYTQHTCQRNQIFPNQFRHQRILSKEEIQVCALEHGYFSVVLLLVVVLVLDVYYSFSLLQMKDLLSVGLISISVRAVLNSNQSMNRVQVKLDHHHHYRCSIVEQDS